MRDAGRIGFDIKGTYNSAETYEFLDVVYYQNSSYVAKKETTGNAPADNNEFWQILARGESTGGDADASDMTVEFERATTMANISTGEKLSVLFGKIKKWFTELPGTRVMGVVHTLTDFSQLNNTYRYWKIDAIDATYAEQIGIRNVGDFYAFILSYNGNENIFHFGNIVLTSPRLANNDYYKITMWDGVPTVTLSRGYVPSLTNNFLATVPGQSALDAAAGSVLKGTLDAATQMLFLDHPRNKEEVYDFIFNNYGLFAKTQSLSIMIYSEGAVLGAGEGSGMFVGTLYHFNGNIIGELINIWNQNQKLSLIMTTYQEEKYILIKTVNYEYLQQQINQINSDLSATYAIDISKYVWTAGFASIFKRAGISFINLGLNDVTCEANNGILTIPDACVPAVYTTILGSIFQNGEFKTYEFYIANGVLATGMKLINAHILICGFWKTAK